MIVKNEADRIERCLASVLPYVKAVAILDTGSTDDTRAKIKAICEAAGVPSFTHAATFKNFSQARNDAFGFAQRAAQGGCMPFCQFAILMDADMELVVDDPKAFDKLDATAMSYDMMQKAGPISYGNRRLVNLQLQHNHPYVGVTHEYIDVPAAGMITGARFIDHADGSNRADKYPRDAHLLEQALLTDPDNGRSLYYLGNTYRDWAATVPTVLPYAIDAYQKRIALGGWAEETHSAMMNLAWCYRAQKHDAGFVSWMIDAYHFRPQRAEPLYELAKFYREKDQAHAALLFAKAGLNIKRPDDLLFVNDFIYNHGMRYEYSIAGFYNQEERSRAFAITNDLALDPTCPEPERLSCRNNLYWYTKPLGDLCSSFKAQQIEFEPPAGYVAMNPSIVECNGRLRCNLRCVNYKIDAQGRYMIGPKECNDAPIDTRNFLLKLDVDLKVKEAAELLWHREPPKFNMVTGLEDIRLWWYFGNLHFNATVRETSMFGTCQQISGRIELAGDDPNAHVVDAEIMSGDDQHEKNWMAMPSRPFSAPRFLYRADTTIEPPLLGVKGYPPTKFDLGLDVSRISGSSQAIPFKSGLLAVVHEAATGPDGKRTYWHRFAWFETVGCLRRLSMPFVFLDRQIEFCAGLARHPNYNDLIVSFGVRDEQAWLGTISAEEVSMVLIQVVNEN